MKYQFMGFDEATLKKFWSKVDKRGPDECWVWLGCCSGGRYGAMRVNGKQLNTHRIALMLGNPPLSSNFSALHKCDNIKCCNPTHLYWGSHQDNMNDLKSRNTDWRNNCVKASSARRKLTPFRLYEVAVLIHNGASYQSAATQFGVTQGAISWWRSKLPLY
jgi:hypothetical protein